MDLATVTFNSAATLIQYVLAPATIILVFLGLIIYWRSGTAHTLLLKLWSVFAGPANIKSPSVSKFASDEQDLAHFRFMTRARVSTLREAERLISWGDQYNVSIHLIRASGQYFDLDKPAPHATLFALRVTKLFLPFICFVFLVSLTASGLFLAFGEQAILRIKASGNYYAIDENYLSPFLSQEKLHWAECGREDIAPSINKDDRTQLCAMKRDKAFTQAIEENVRAQRAGGWFLAAEALIALFAVVVAARTIVKARALQSKLRAQGISAPYQAQLSET